VVGLRLVSPGDYISPGQALAPLEQISVLDGTAHMNENAGPYRGLSREQARKQVVNDLESAGLLEKIEPHSHAIGVCSRCDTIVEPMLSEQWFLRMKEMADRAIKAVRDGDTTFHPKFWENTFFNWLENIHDWCISRQLWWGHRIPAYRCARCDHLIVAAERPSRCPECDGSDIIQDDDVLDTWFSSGLWPFSTMGWPDQTEDLQVYYPTTLLITGFDIIFFWVARMIVLGLECMGQVPFRQVYIHGLIRDAERQKMSKTKGNVIDPLVVTEKYGTDAVRLALVMGAAPGTDIVLSQERMESTRAFANKIWNAARFLFLNMERSGVAPWVPGTQDQYKPEADAETLTVPLEDRWIFSRLNACAEQANAAIAQYRFHEAAQVLWQFFWHEFCDWYLEIAKRSLYQTENRVARAVTQHTLVETLETTLRLLHPFMPFVTEEIWEKMTGEPGTLIVAPYPQGDPAP